MKALAKGKNGSIAKEYEKAIEQWITQEAQNILLADSQILQYVEQRITKSEERLAKMIARMGMDVAVCMIAELRGIANEFGMTERDVYEQLRPMAAKHFSSSRKDSIQEEL